MGRIVIKLGLAPDAGEAERDMPTILDREARGTRAGAAGGLGRSLQFDMLRRFYFQPALLVVDLETLETQCVVVPPDQRVVLGRGPECDVMIRSDNVSRLHAEVCSHGRGALTIRDLGSTNGTTHNNVPVPQDAPVPLGPGDVAVLGTSYLLRAFPLGSSPAHSGESFLFPLWVFLGQAQAERSLYHRCSLVVSAFEHLARIIVFLDAATQEPGASLAPLLGRSRLSMGQWIQGARGALTGAGAGGVGLLLEDGSGGRLEPRGLLDHLASVVEWRNANLGHGAPQPDAVYRRPFTELAGRFREVLETYTAFRDALVVTTSRCTVRADGAFEARVIVHDPVWGFRRPMAVQRAAPLRPGAYLIVPETDELLPLGDRVREGVCPACGGEELFVAEGLASTAPYVAPLTNHHARAQELTA